MKNIAKIWNSNHLFATHSTRRGWSPLKHTHKSTLYTVEPRYTNVPEGCGQRKQSPTCRDPSEPANAHKLKLTHVNLLFPSESWSRDRPGLTWNVETQKKRLQVGWKVSGFCWIVAKVDFLGVYVQNRYTNPVSKRRGVVFFTLRPHEKGQVPETVSGQTSHIDSLMNINDTVVINDLLHVSTWRKNWFLKKPSITRFD